jgi:glycosyl transferase family 25
LEVPIYVINLERSEARRSAMTRQISALGLPFTMVKAVDGKNVDRETLHREYSSSDSKRIHGRDLKDTEIASALSHISVYQGMVQDGMECAVILEDDVYVGAAFKMFVSSLPSMIEDDWEIINLFSHRSSVPFGDPVFDIYRYSRFSGACNMAAAYALKLSGATKLLRHAYPIRFAGDGLTGRFHETGIEMRGLLPHVVQMMEVPSDIGSRG